MDGAWETLSSVREQPLLSHSVTSFSVSHSKLLFMHDFERDGVNIFKSLGTMTNNVFNQKGRVSTPASLRLPGSTH
jgi:hypothetical protein